MHLQTDLTAYLEEWLTDHPETTPNMVELALLDVGTNYAAKFEMARDDADDRGDWLMERQRDRVL